MTANAQITGKTPLLGFCAYGSGTGKTTLLASLIPVLNAHGLRISVIKNAHHSFDIDHPGKDSYRLRESGAVQMLLGSRHRWALMTELSRIPDRQPDDPGLAELLTHIDASLADLILVEGFRNEAIPKIEIYRPELDNPLLSNHDSYVIAIASNAKVATHLPLLDLNNPEEIAAFILDWLKITPQPGPANTERFPE
ncbi:Molybdopterin-guanine dinucleotide biosynthesis adapter protein [Methylophilaceae bacterium]|nr:Molybdopterin-guanine dinucleotide biosynthesis adapter protein [Methylophilaceae bacterium]